MELTDVYSRSNPDRRRALIEAERKQSDICHPPHPFVSPFSTLVGTAYCMKNTWAAWLKFLIIASCSLLYLSRTLVSQNRPRRGQEQWTALECCHGVRDLENSTEASVPIIYPRPGLVFDLSDERFNFCPKLQFRDCRLTRKRVLIRWDIPGISWLAGKGGTSESASSLHYGPLIFGRPLFWA